jgi:serine/threonine-protein kinase ATR
VFSLMQQVRLVRATGEPLRALQELEHYLQTTRRQDDSADVIDLTEDENELKPLKAKVR